MRFRAFLDLGRSVLMAEYLAEQSHCLVVCWGCYLTVCCRRYLSYTIGGPLG